MWLLHGEEQGPAKSADAGTQNAMGHGDWVHVSMEAGGGVEQRELSTDNPLVATQRTFRKVKPSPHETLGQGHKGTNTEVTQMRVRK